MRWRDSKKTKGSQDQGGKSGWNLPCCGIVPKLQKNSEGAQVPDLYPDPMYPEHADCSLMFPNSGQLTGSQSASWLMRVPFLSAHLIAHFPG